MTTEETAVPAGEPTIGRPGAYAKGMARRRQILDRAIEVFRERGADGTSLRRIAEAIGVSHAALRHYFDSLEQLLVAVYEHSETARHEDPDSLEPTSAVDVMVTSAVQNLEVPGLVQLYSTLVAASLESRSTEAREYFTRRFETVRTSLVERVREEQEAGDLRGDVDAARIAALLIAASDGLQIQWLLEPSIDLEGTLSEFHTLLRP
ncbi:TetR family transcriptional regulator [Brachybacterium endophyticum]|uniref:TetR family transcriptional regulator n=1 Tax=Brachybacterium endophyticum TaxID=2182385 RepID=A0A2U2RNR4_9MICO|nr:TetR/AcrR family transcriptional regulator [Brachybacterium endophyticum]PWH07518.1 TetR family transcriptional regulator [Brachybacterium endophyticum]